MEAVSTPSNSRNRTKPVCLTDFQDQAKDSLSKIAYEYFSSGAENEETLRENREAFKRIKLRPRMLRGISHVNMSTTILGQPISMPVCIAPTAFHKMAHPHGELATARAAAQAGTCMTLTWAANSSIEDVAATAPAGVKWLLIYMMKDRELVKAWVRRAEESGFSGIVVTVDSPEGPKNYSIERNKFTLPSTLTIPNLGHKKYVLKSVDGNGNTKFVSAGNELFDGGVTWKSIDWLKKLSRLPIVLKGILTPEDARLAVEHGVDGIIVSNHGGRQLDGVQATIDALPEIVKAVQGKLEVYMDGGVRLGTDVFKALALGARAVFVGRPVIWGLAYKGEEGVRQVLELLREELRLAMILSGCGSLDDVTSSYVIPANQSARL
ncbi:glycolate oxidase 5 isoform X1 [Nematostella vectensis]|uniref:glycolate oxidase 5 isoform X1 n=1 Tax=Nematostella vectensis TaxID=45351 RepID=UPI002076F6EE|nr:glycolate oxidase 5 isoform X1 [Nematostella vectensis]